MGDVKDFRNFMGAVIDRRRFDRISGYLADGKKNAKILAGGGANGETGWFVEPTLVADGRSGVPADVRGDLRTGRHGVRLRRRQMGTRR